MTSHYYPIYRQATLLVCKDINTACSSGSNFYVLFKMVYSATFDGAHILITLLTSNFINIYFTYMNAAYLADLMSWGGSTSLRQWLGIYPLPKIVNGANSVMLAYWNIITAPLCMWFMFLRRSVSISYWNLFQSVIFTFLFCEKSDI